MTSLRLLLLDHALSLLAQSRQRGARPLLGRRRRNRKRSPQDDIGSAHPFRERISPNGRPFVLPEKKKATRT